MKLKLKRSKRNKWISSIVHSKRGLTSSRLGGFWPCVGLFLSINRLYKGLKNYD